MRWCRLLISLVISRFRPKLTIGDTSTVTFTVWLTDIDASIMNHAAMMTVFETGRIDFMVRTGFFKIARRRKWFFPSASITVQFVRPLKIFQKAQLTTKLLHVSEHCIFTEQKISRHGKDIAICIVKSKIKSGRETVLTREILHTMNTKDWINRSGELVEYIERNDALIRQSTLSKPNWRNTMN